MKVLAAAFRNVSDNYGRHRLGFTRSLTLFDTLEPDGVFAVFDHGVHVPGGESSHGGVIDFQEELLRAQLAAAARRSAREELADNRELSVLRAALQLQPELPLLIPAEHALVDFALGHGSKQEREKEKEKKERKENHMSTSFVSPVTVVGSGSGQMHFAALQSSVGNEAFPRITAS
ncbi:hypothetical protein EYF80_020949 [Liparis tanakae]|uniref:Uncharacterized protein n=1 Tax=Liparis tanakae TaxID=230148 RepID=A0A4Z2HT90_9TELE|nr:hypothetical protein EYF80_020949 [Liparis tanakae]